MVVCLFKFGKLSTVKHTVASVGLTSSIRAPPGRGVHGNQLLYGPPPRAGGVTLGFRFGISSDRLLKFAACFH